MNWLVPSPVVLPLVVAAALVAAAPICRRRLADTAAILTALAVTVLSGALLHRAAANTIVYWFGGWAPRGTAAVGIAFVVDPLGAGAAVCCGALTTVTLLYAWQYFAVVRTYSHALLLLFLAGMVGFCLSGDLFDLFVFFELMSVVAYALTAYKVEEVKALIGAINFAVINSVGGFLVLIGIALLYGRTGALNLAQVGAALARGPVAGLPVVALALITAGFLVKAAAVPFHFWLADAHAVAPSPVCVLFSGIMIELGLYGALRVYWTVFHPAFGAAEAHLRVVFWVIGVLTAVVGAVLCVSERHLKRLLAFSSISHIGMMLTGAACLTASGIAGAALYVLGHACVKGALFLCAGILLHRFGSVDLHELAGRGRRRDLVVVGAAFAVCALGLAGFPPFGTYLGKQMMEEAGAQVGQHWFTWLFLFASALTGGAVLRAGVLVFVGCGQRPGGRRTRPDEEERETRGGEHRVPPLMLGAVLLLTAAPLASAAFGGPLATALHAASERFVDQAGYAAAVLRAQPTGALPAVAPVRSTTSGVVFGCLAAAAAVAVAVVLLLRRRLPRPVRVGFARLFDAPIGGLRALHRGHPGDLVVWLLIGVVALGAGLAAVVAAAAPDW